MLRDVRTGVHAGGLNWSRVGHAVYLFFPCGFLIKPKATYPEVVLPTGSLALLPETYLEVSQKEEILS